MWIGPSHSVSGSAFGLNLLIPADVYQKSIRTSKYDLLFIVFTFTAFFFSEIISRKRIHLIQYLLVGLAITMFYMLLLSISEHYGFDWAYLISAVAVTTLITFYSGGIIKGRRFTGTVFGTLTILYIFFYSVLQAEDHGLIMGSLGLFAVLSIVMVGTRQIDWYALESGEVSVSGEGTDNCEEE